MTILKIIKFKSNLPVHVFTKSTYSQHLLLLLFFRHNRFFFSNQFLFIILVAVLFIQRCLLIITCLVPIVANFIIKYLFCMLINFYFQLISFHSRKHLSVVPKILYKLSTLGSFTFWLNYFFFVFIYFRLLLSYFKSKKKTVYYLSPFNFL